MAENKLVTILKQGERTLYISVDLVLIDLFSSLISEYEKR